MKKNLLKIKIPEAYKNRILHVGDEVFILFNPCGNELGYRYYPATILSISLLGEWDRPKEDVDSVQVLETENDIVLAKQFTIKLEYYLNNVRQWTFLSMWKDFSKLYLPEEKDILEKDIKKLNEILDLKRTYKNKLQDQINNMLQDWDYRGTIKI